MSKVMTVQGPISPDELGITLSHTHLLMNLLCWYIPPMEASKLSLSEEPLKIENLGMVRRDALSVKDNLIMGDVETAIQELMEYKRMGGKTIVEVTMPGIGRDPIGLKKISAATGVNVICSTGWYIAPSHPSYVKEKSIDELCDIMVKEIEEGIGNTGIKAGAIGEIAMSGAPDVPFEKEEEKVLRAAARAQSKTGIALTIHPNPLGPHFETYLNIIEEEGADLKKCFMSHMEHYCPNMYYPSTEYQRLVLERGVSISFDQFGQEAYLSVLGPGKGFPTDRQRVADLLGLLKAGYEKQILLSNEICMKIYYKKYGGYGYSHILENILSELRYNGITEEQIHTMLVENPKQIFSY